MAVSTMSGSFGVVSQITVILNEGTVTVGTSSSFYGGAKLTTCTPASEIVKDEWVTLSTDTANTYEATGGLPVVTKVSTSGTVWVGKIIDTPRWVVEPATTQTTWSTMLSSKYYRVATVEFAPLQIHKVTLNSSGTSAITPGTVALLKVSGGNTSGATRMNVVDVASGGGAGWFSFHYAPSTNGSAFSLLIGIPSGGFGVFTT